MDSALGTLVVALLGVTFGWEPVDDGSAGVEYVVQLEPELVDVLQSGQAVPIESYIPADVGPIRKVRITVGEGDLPRTLQTPSAAGETIVRGQNDEAPLRHTARRDGWSDDRYQYNQPQAWPTNTTANAPPAASWSQPAAEPPRVAAAVAQQPASAGWSSIGTGMAPPPLLTPSQGPPAVSATSSTLMSPTQGGFHLATPMSDFGGPATSASDPWAPLTVAGSGASPRGTLSLPDPPPTSRSQAPDLWPASPAGGQSAATSPGWDWPANSASGTPAGSIVDRGTPDSDLVPVSPTSSRRQGQPAASDWSWPTDGQTAATQSSGSYRDDWPANAQPNNAPLASSPRVPLQSDWPAETRVAASESWGDPRPTQPLSLPAPPVSQPQTGPHLPELTTGPALAHGAPAATALTAAGQQLPPQQPWMPLLLVSLGLAGSIGANFYLGWSYMDARQRYRSLVDKTAEVFRRVTGAAA